MNNYEKAKSKLNITKAANKEIECIAEEWYTESRKRRTMIPLEFRGE